MLGPNPERKAKAFVEDFESTEYVLFTKKEKCIFCGGRRGIVTGHVIHSRGAGGKAADTGPVCFTCDGIWENKGRDTLLARRGLTWEEVVSRVRAHHAKWAARKDEPQF